jgi:hypothetical protein
MSGSASIHGSASVSKPASATGSKISLFRVLTLAATALMLVSWLLPWWRAVILELNRYVEIRPWGLEHTLADMFDYIKSAPMPSWFAPFMWAYLGIALVALLYSLVAPEKVLRLGKFALSLPQLLIAGVGVSYIAVLLVMIVYASIRVDDFWHLKLIGKTFVEAGEIEKSYVEANLQPGYWLAWVAGSLCVILGLFRSKIIGNR